MKTVPLTNTDLRVSALLGAAENGESAIKTADGKPVATTAPIDRNFGKHLLNFPGGVDLERNNQPSREVDL